MRDHTTAYRINMISYERRGAERRPERSEAQRRAEKRI